ncbi:MAG: serine/threonine-protein kinase [Burkholderiaceae bacterium]
MNAEPRLIGPYRLLERLGEGGMGEVFRAVDTMLEREVALKTLRPEMSARDELVERFRVEAIALAKLHHRHIAAVYAFFRDGEQHHIAMQYVRGRTLEARLRERGRLPWREAAALAADVLLALEHAHALGVVHRDLKPANLMVDDDGRAVVMDFGIARVLAKGRQTRAGKLVGTLEYIAPEIVRGEAADARSDLYALGCVLYEMVTGELPFQAESDYALMRAHAEQAPPRPGARAAELPPALEAIILRALAKQPAERFADAQSFRAALLLAAGAPAGADAGADGAERAPAPLAEHRWSMPASLALDHARRALRSALLAARGWLELPRGGGWHAWAPWLRANPGLAGVAAVVAGGASFVIALNVYTGWSSATPVARPASRPLAPSTQEPVVPARAPIAPTPIAATPVVATPVVVTPVAVAEPKAAEPRPTGSVFVMPPPPKPRISIERAPVRPPNDAAPAPPAVAAPPAAEAKPEPKPAPGGSWYVKH